MSTAEATLTAHLLLMDGHSDATPPFAIQLNVLANRTAATPVFVRTTSAQCTNVSVTLAAKQTTLANVPMANASAKAESVSKRNAPSTRTAPTVVFATTTPRRTQLGNATTSTMTVQRPADLTLNVAPSPSAKTKSA
jgi:hypothetical protein